MKTIETVDSERKDLVTYTTAPLTKDIEIAGPMTATLYKTHPSFVRLPIMPR